MNIIHAPSFIKF